MKIQFVHETYLDLLSKELKHWLKGIPEGLPK